MEIIKDNMAGDPMGYKGIWTHLKVGEIVSKLKDKNIEVSNFVVSKLLSLNGLTIKKLKKYETIKETEGRDEQFNIITKLIKEAKESGIAIELL